MVRGEIVDIDGLPDKFPTHRHVPKFWECLGRAIATFGFLEEVLARAIFAFTATQRPHPEDVNKVFEQWLSTLKKAVSDPLGNLITSYEKAVRENPDATLDDVKELLCHLKKTKEIRDILCHGSWGMPDKNGRSVPFFVNRKMMKFDSPVDIYFLEETQQHVACLACEVINSVTRLGWQFPGSGGPGNPIVGD